MELHDFIESSMGKYGKYLYFLDKLRVNWDVNHLADLQPIRVGSIMTSQFFIDLMWVKQCHKSLISSYIGAICFYKPFPVMGGLWHCFTPTNYSVVSLWSIFYCLQNHDPSINHGQILWIRRELGEYQAIEITKWKNWLNVWNSMFTFWWQCHLKVTQVEHGEEKLGFLMPHRRT